MQQAILLARQKTERTVIPVDKVTPDMFMTFMIVAAALAAFVLLILNIAEKIKAARKPKTDLEHWQSETDAKLKNDKDRLDVLEDGNKVICRGILALLSHEINGNSTDKLKASQSEITNYLIDR